ncbi:MAG: glycoside hydrolase family 2 TIM barrel-domain containing protein [Luteolibacter sp.]
MVHFFKAKGLLCLLTLAVSTLPIIAEPANTYSLNGTWRFALAPTEADAANLAEFYRADFQSENFKETPVPSNWAVLGYEEPVYRGFKDHKASEGFYLHDFTPPQDWKNKRVLLHFGGVWSSAEVWLNGNRVGRHDSGYTSFAFDISGKIKIGEANRLAVRVRQVTPEYKFDVYDDWTIGGIYRDVTLEAMPENRWLDRVIVQTEFDDQFRDADLKIRAMVSDRNSSRLPGNYPLPGEPYELRFTLKTKDGKEVASQRISLEGHTATDRETSVTLRIQAPAHWTAETSNLYQLDVDLLENGKIAHSRTEQVGFREISTKGGVFRINGQAVKLRGVNRHDEHPDVGRATTREHWIQDIKLMKAANINYIRLAHYTPAEGFIKLCDEMGMYVGNEVSIGGAADLLYDPSFSGAVLQRSYETVMRDINKPSIVYWSIGNEDALTSLHMASVKLVKALDPTRPVLLPWRSEGWLPPEIDILAPHYWKPDEYDQHAGNANRPIISTEYTHAYGEHGLGALETRWKGITQHPAGAGAAIWLWADQGLKTPIPKKKGGDDRARHDEYLRITGEGWDGIVDSYRNPTRDYEEVKAVYAPVYPSVETVSFQPGDSAVRIPIRNVYDFTNLNTVKIAWSIHEDAKELDSGTTSLSGVPHADAIFELPLGKLATIQSGKTYYARFVFTDTTGHEITRKAVELESLEKPVTASLPTSKPIVSQGDSVTIEAADSTYQFNPATGQLISASRGGKSLITDLHPVIWRKLDPNESIVPNARQVRGEQKLETATPTATSWTIDEKAGNVEINTTVKYAIDAENSYTTQFRYNVSSDGSLNVHYEILPTINAPWVPVVGMVVKSAPELTRLDWLGLGPFDAYPNKRSAPILGVWGGTAGKNETSGPKAIRWVERSNSDARFRITSTGYLECDADAPENMRILSGLLGRPEKGRKADESIPQLETKTGKPFVGSLRIELP